MKIPVTESVISHSVRLIFLHFRMLALQKESL
jgi:hypothetical protein